MYTTCVTTSCIALLLSSATLIPAAAAGEADGDAGADLDLDTLSLPGALMDAWLTESEDALKYAAAKAISATTSEANEVVDMEFVSTSAAEAAGEDPAKANQDWEGTPLSIAALALMSGKDGLGWLKIAQALLARDDIDVNKGVTMEKCSTTISPLYYAMIAVDNSKEGAVELARALIGHAGINVNLGQANLLWGTDRYSPPPQVAGEKIKKYKGTGMSPLVMAISDIAALSPAVIAAGLELSLALIAHPDIDVNWGIAGKSRKGKESGVGSSSPLFLAVASLAAPTDEDGKAVEEGTARLIEEAAVKVCDALLAHQKAGAPEPAAGSTVDTTSAHGGIDVNVGKYDMVKNAKGKKEYRHMSPREITQSSKTKGAAYVSAKLLALSLWGSFKRMDLDGDKRHTKDEIVKFFQAMGQSQEDAEAPLQEIMKQMDLDGDEIVSFDEYVAYTQLGAQKNGKVKTELTRIANGQAGVSWEEFKNPTAAEVKEDLLERAAHLEESFDAADTDGDQRHSALELEEFMEKLGQDVDVEKIMQQMDTDEDEFVSWDEFVLPQLKEEPELEEELQRIGARKSAEAEEVGTAPEEVEEEAEEVGTASEEVEEEAEEVGTASEEVEEEAEEVGTASTPTPTIPAEKVEEEAEVETDSAPTEPATENTKDEL